MGHHSAFTALSSNMNTKLIFATALCQVLLGSAMARDVSAGNRINTRDDEQDPTEQAIDDCLAANGLTVEELEVLAVHNATDGGNLTATVSATVTEEVALDAYTCMWERFPAAVSYITIQLAMGGTPDAIPENRIALVAQDRFPCFGLCAATYKIVKLLLIPLCFWFPLG